MNIIIALIITSATVFVGLLKHRQQQVAIHTAGHCQVQQEGA